MRAMLTVYEAAEALHSLAVAIARFTGWIAG